MTTYLLEQPKSRKPTPLNAGEDVELMEPSFTVGNANGTATLTDSLVASYKTKPTFTIGSSNCAHLYVPEGVKNLCVHKNLHTNIYSAYIHNYQNLEVGLPWWSSG